VQLFAFPALGAKDLGLASLEYINFKPLREVIEDGALNWVPDKHSRAVRRLPQIFWDGGEGWAEANYWALDRASHPQADVETVKALMKHLYAYASFLEETEMDWRHFPMRLADRAVIRFRGRLIEQIDNGALASSTARARMAAVVQFYRHAQAHGFVTAESPLWRDRAVVIPYHDDAGFQRTMVRVTTDLAIPNRARPGVTLEDGLTPLRTEHMEQLLSFALENSPEELHLMLLTGFFTGARIETILTLSISNLERAMPDPFMKGFSLLRVGPGTGVATKFNVEGALLVPDFLLAELKAYAYSTRRLLRESKAAKAHRTRLFLTKNSVPYASASVTRLMTDLRRATLAAGLRFMDRFKFHQSRATYGTWLMQLALSATSEANAIALVKGAMLHKHEATTFRYVRFLGVSKGKAEAAEAFTKVFTGLSSRDWSQLHA
jgi:integrase